MWSTCALMSFIFAFHWFCYPLTVSTGLLSHLCAGQEILGSTLTPLDFASCNDLRIGFSLKTRHQFFFICLIEYGLWALMPCNGLIFHTPFLVWLCIPASVPEVWSRLTSTAQPFTCLSLLTYGPWEKDVSLTSLVVFLLPDHEPAVPCEFLQAFM